MTAMAVRAPRDAAEVSARILTAHPSAVLARYRNVRADITLSTIAGRTCAGMWLAAGTACD